jgi:hypothetical protein
VWTGRIDDNGRGPQNERRLEVVGVRPRPSGQQRQSFGEKPALLAGASRPRRIGQLLVDLVDLCLEIAFGLCSRLGRTLANSEQVDVGKCLRQNHGRQ